MRRKRRKALAVKGTSKTVKDVSKKRDAWAALRGALKDVFAELGGGEAYLRAERENFYAAENEGNKLPPPSFSTSK